MAQNADTALIAKVEAQAGMVNHRVLSDQELEWCKEILSNEERVLSQLDAEFEALRRKRDLQQQRVQKLHVAVAPHKRLPPEILSHIFVLCLPVAHDKVAIPPVLCKAPWLLGRVCSRWRSISRGERRLWGKVTIKVNAPTRRRDLLRACEILPPAAEVSVEATCRIPGFQTDVIHHLWRAQEFFFTVDCAKLKQVWRIISASPQSFAALRTVVLCVDGMPRAVDKVDTWTGVKPFRMAKSLKELRIAMSATLWPAFLSLDIPWSQLKAIDITGVANLSLEGIFGLLNKCHSLEELSITSPRGRQTGTTRPGQEPLKIPSLRSLCVKDILSPSLINEANLWNNLSTLDLWCAKFEDGRALHSILKHCGRLVDLCSPVPALPPGCTLGGRTLRCPYLTNVELGATRDTWLFATLDAPALANLSCIFTQASDLRPLRDMLAASRCPLHALSIEYDVLDDGLCVRVLPAGLGALLAAAPGITELNLFLGLLVPRDVLRDIGAGVLVPRLAELAVTPDDLEGFLQMVETRAESEARQGRKGLCDVQVFVSSEDYDEDDPDVIDALESRLDAVQSTYGIRCGLQVH